MYWSPLLIPELKGMRRDDAVALLVKSNKEFNPWLRTRAACVFATLVIPALMTAERGVPRPLLVVGMGAMGAIYCCYFLIEWNTSMRRAVAKCTGRKQPESTGRSLVG